MIPDSLLRKRAEYLEKSKDAQQTEEQKSVAQAVEKQKIQEIVDKQVGHMVNYAYAQAIKMCENEFIIRGTFKTDWNIDGYIQNQRIRFTSYVSFDVPQLDLLLKTQTKHPHARIQFLHECRHGLETHIRNQFWIWWLCSCDEKKGKPNLMRISIQLPRDCLMKEETVAKCVSK